MGMPLGKKKKGCNTGTQFWKETALLKSPSFFEAF